MLVGAHGEDGSRILMVQRKVPLKDLEPAGVITLLRDLIHQYRTILANASPQKIDG